MEPTEWSEVCVLPQENTQGFWRLALRKQERTSKQHPRSELRERQFRNHISKRFRTVQTEAKIPIQLLEPMLLPKLRIYFADFLISLYPIDQSLQSSDSGCGYRYGQAKNRKGSRKKALSKKPRTPPPWSKNAPNSLSKKHFLRFWMWISDGAFRRIVKAPRTAQIKARRFPYVFRRFSPPEMIFKASAMSKRKDNSPQARLPWRPAVVYCFKASLLEEKNFYIPPFQCSPRAGFGILNPNSLSPVAKWGLQT